MNIHSAPATCVLSLDPATGVYTLEVADESFEKLLTLPKTGAFPQDWHAAGLPLLCTERLQDDAYLQTLIRSRLNYVYPGEIGFVVLDKETATQVSAVPGALVRVDLTPAAGPAAGSHEPPPHHPRRPEPPTRR